MRISCLEAILGNYLFILFKMRLEIECQNVILNIIFEDFSSIFFSFLLYYVQLSFAWLGVYYYAYTFYIHFIINNIFWWCSKSMSLFPLQTKYTKNVFTKCKEPTSTHIRIELVEIYGIYFRKK